MTEPFEITFNPDKALMQAYIHTDLTLGAWDAFMAQFRTCIREQQVFWQVDLTRLLFMETNGLSVLISMLASVRNRGGTLRILVAEGSQPADLFAISKLDRIMAIDVLPSDHTSRLPGFVPLSSIGGLSTAEPRP